MDRPYTVGIGRQPYRDKVNPFKATTLESGIPELRLYHDVHVEHAVFTLSTEFHDWRRSWVLDVSEIRLDREPATDALNSRSRDHGKNDPRRNRQARSEQRPHAHSLPPGESALMPRPSSGSHPAGRPSERERARLYRLPSYKAGDNLPFPGLVGQSVTDLGLHRQHADRAGRHRRSRGR